MDNESKERPDSGPAQQATTRIPSASDGAEPEDGVISAPPASLVYRLVGGSVLLGGVAGVLAQKNQEERIDRAMERWENGRWNHLRRPSRGSRRKKHSRGS